MTNYMEIIRNKKDDRTVLVEKCFNIYCKKETGYWRESKKEHFSKYRIFIDDASIEERCGFSKEICFFEIDYSRKFNYFSEQGDYYAAVFSDLYVEGVSFIGDKGYGKPDDMTEDEYEHYNYGEYRFKTNDMDDKYNEILQQIFENLKHNGRILRWKPNKKTCS
jgi:hypothetical protein